MRVDPAIAALRSNRAPQRQAQSAMQGAWNDCRADPVFAQALCDLDVFGRGAPIEECPALEQAFAASGTAGRLMAHLAGRFCTVLAHNPLGHPPFRHGFDGRAATILLARSGTAQLLLQSREPGDFSYPCATFTDALRYDATLAGRGEAQILRIRGPRDRVEFAAEAMELQPGVRLAFDCSTETLHVTKVMRRLVTLRLLRGSADPEPGLEYCLETGRLLHRSAGTLASSRREMMAALLGRMQWTEAAPVLAHMAATEQSESLRWQSLRECLALDTQTGFIALSDIARDQGDSLSAPAGALRAQLVETYPQLLELEKIRCPG